MRHSTYTDLRKNLSAYMNQVNDDHTPLLVTRSRGKPVVIMSLEDYERWDETAYLLASPNNARELRASIAEYEKSGGTVRELLE